MDGGSRLARAHRSVGGYGRVYLKMRHDLDWQPHDLVADGNVAPRNTRTICTDAASGDFTVGSVGVAFFLSVFSSFRVDSSFLFFLFF